MSFLIALFIASQSFLLLLLCIHDWVDLAPFNDVKATRATSSLFGLITTTIINCFFIGAVIAGTCYFSASVIPLWFSRFLIITYALFCFGAFMYWYRPMLFGAAEWHKESFREEYANTHHLLPGDNETVRPNTIHILIHILILIGSTLAFYNFFYGF